MKKSIFAAALAGAAMLVACGGSKSGVTMGSLSEFDSLSYALGANIGYGMKYQMRDIPFDYKAIDKVVAVHGDLAEFSVKAITRGIDAIGEVTVRITAEDGKVYTGRGADNDIIVSSAKAYVNAINRMIQTARSKEGK